jgi:hypothetical protein
MDAGLKQAIVDRLGLIETNAQATQEGVDVVDRYLKTDEFRELVAIANEHDLELFISGLDGPVVLRLREKP